MSTRRFFAAYTAIACLALAGCGTQRGPAASPLGESPASGTTDEWSESCSVDQLSERFYPPALDYISNESNRWFLIKDYTPAQSDPVGLDDAPLLRVSVTTTDGKVLPTRDARFDKEQRAAIDWALKEGGIATAVVDQSLADNFIAPLFVLITPARGEPFFVGNCASQNFEKPLRATFGQEYAATLRGLAVGPVAVTSLPTTPDTNPDQILAPGDAPEALLSRLTQLSLAVQLPEQWSTEGDQRSHYVLITRVPQGWNDAVSLSYPTTATQPARIGAYLPAEGTVEFWILANDGDFRHQVRKIGTAGSGELLAIAASKPAGEQGVVDVKITSDSSIADLVESRGDVDVRVEPAA